MWAMKRPANLSDRRLLATRIVAGLAVAFLLVATHQMLGGVSESGTAEPGPLSQVTSSSVGKPHASVAPVEDPFEAPDGRGSSECGVAMICIAVAVGGGAFLVLRRRRSDRILWLAPQLLHIKLSSVIQATQSLMPLQRSSLLRC